VTFGILFRCFAYRVFFLLHCSLPSKFLNLIHHFLFHPDGSFLKAFRSKLIEVPQAPLIHRQVGLPISSGGIRLISSKFITLSYLESWDFVTLIIAFRFFLDFHFF
jgi:hypothetical protein